MAYKGQIIYNKVTQEKFTWLDTSKDTNGKFIRFDCEMAPGGKVAVRHVHPNQDETFEIKEGVMRLEINGETKLYKRGDKVTIPEKKPHEWSNGSLTEPLQMTVTFQPALKTEIFFEQFFGLGNDGKTDRNGSPSFMQVMAMCNEYEIYLASLPLALQKIMGFTVGGIARLMGKKKYYPEYSISR
jgi:quercetin dioxygenase-like cupin family protein